MIIFILILILILGIIVLAFFLYSGVFTTVLTGTEKYVIQGEKYIETIDDDTEQNPFWKFFGVHFVGFSFQGYSIHHFDINTDKENEEPKKGDSSTWLIKQGKKKKDFLLKKIPRMLVVNDIEIGGNKLLQVDLGLALVFKAINGRKFVFDYKADFVVPVGLIKSKVNKLVSDLKSYNDVIQKVDWIAEEIINDSELDTKLDEFGLELIEIKVVQTATDRRIEDASTEELAAELIAKAGIATAQGKATEIGLIAKAEADAIKLKLEQEISALKAQGLNTEEIAEIMKRKYTSATTLVTDLFNFKK